MPKCIEVFIETSYFKMIFKKRTNVNVLYKVFFSVAFFGSYHDIPLLSISLFYIFFPFKIK